MIKYHWEIVVNSIVIFILGRGKGDASKESKSIV